MYGKKTETKFTVQFNRSDPAHLRVADILNRQGRYGKSQYIVNAVTKYINNGEKPDTRRPVLIDEKHIEAVVNRILRDRGGIAADVLPAAVPVGKDEQPLYKDTNIDFDDAVEILGADGINTITGALDMFRKK